VNAAVIHASGEPPQFEQFSEPVPAENEVLVQVLAAGLHPVVKALASGSHYGSTGGVPFIPGVDGVGRLDDGVRVYFAMVRRPYGTMAERAVAPRSMCWPLPAGLDDTTAAAIANPGMSALLGLSRRAKLVPGESVLVLGATGEFRIDVEKAPLERVEEMWQREFHGRRLVLVP
jgi:NADPH:quinone reductase-like Zn-dependent oxidoreductase